MSVFAGAGVWVALLAPAWQASSSGDSEGGWVILAVVIGVVVLINVLSTPQTRRPPSSENPPEQPRRAPAPRRAGGLGEEPEEQPLLQQRTLPQQRTLLRERTLPEQRPQLRTPRLRLDGKVFIEDDPNLSAFQPGDQVTGKHLKHGLGKDGNDITPALMFAHVLPNERIATTRASARYVVTISWGHQKTAVGPSTYDGICRVTVKERYNNKVLAREDFVNQTTQDLPPGFRGLCAGPLPEEEEISRYLKQLLGILPTPARRG